MVELSPADGGLFALGFAGDTLNTATMLARLGGRVSYLTCLGDDPFSERMLAAWQAEGIDTAGVVRLARRMPGLYAIELDRSGERGFHYWRGEAAARDLARAVNLPAALANVGTAFFSGITLSVVWPEDRAGFLAQLEAARSEGTRIAFDGNFRARQWPDLALARALFERAFAMADLVLTTLDDLAGLAIADTAAQAEAFLSRHGGETVLRVAPDRVLWRRGPGERFRATALSARERVVDTTGAGDSFDAGYLMARLAGHEPEPAIGIAHAVASVVVMHRGALAPRDAADWRGLVGIDRAEGDEP